MRIALVGPRELSDFDKKEIESYIDVLVSQGYEIAILAYHSFENEVFKYFVKNPNYSPRLFIYSFPGLDDLSNKTKSIVELLINDGAHFESFAHQELVVKRSLYVSTWEKILKKCHSVTSFYDGEKTTLMIPIDVAIRNEKKAFVYHLPGSNEEKHLLPPNVKMEQKKHHGLV
jgi:hypothetical protein